MAWALSPLRASDPGAVTAAAVVIGHKLRRLCVKGLRVYGGGAAFASHAADLSLCRLLLHHCCCIRTVSLLLPGKCRPC